MAKQNPEFTKRLKKVIANTGLTNHQFADSAEMGYSTLMNYLKKKAPGRVPEWDQLVKIANVAKVSIDWLLTGRENTTSPTGDNVIKKFKNKEIAESINKNLLELERLSPETFQKVEDMTKGMVIALEVEEKKSGTRGK